MPCGNAVEGLGFYYINSPESFKSKVESKTAVIRVNGGTLIGTRKKILKIAHFKFINILDQLHESFSYGPTAISRHATQPPKNVLVE